jgi:hypothetical protein
LNLGPAGYEPAALNLAELWALAHSSARRSTHATKFTEQI